VTGTAPTSKETHLNPLTQIGVACLVFLAGTAALFTGVAALIRISPSDPGPLFEDTADTDTRSTP
jgi:hypothetical protein